MLKLKTKPFENYFVFKNNRNNKNDEKYSYHEYVVYHLYHGNFTHNYTNTDKNNFVVAYNELKQKYSESNIKSKLTEADKDLTKVYYDLLKEIRKDYTKSHTLTLLLIEIIRNFGWIEFDPSEDAKKISAIQNIKNWSTNKNKLLSTIGNYISAAPKNELSVDDPLYSGIIDPENIISLKPSLLKNLENLEEWKQINTTDLPVKEITFSQQEIKLWLDESENEEIRDGKQLVHDIKRIWANRYYQERSSLINESTFTHDVLSSIINFISPKIFKRWDQAQSLSAKDRGVRKFGDVIGYFTGSDK
ncbi:11697_t:CDS:2, partial [Gigaspora margarita]